MLSLSYQTKRYHLSFVKLLFFPSPNVIQQPSETKLTPVQAPVFSHPIRRSGSPSPGSPRWTLVSSNRLAPCAAVSSVSWLVQSGNRFQRYYYIATERVEANRCPVYDEIKPCTKADASGRRRRQWRQRMAWWGDGGATEGRKVVPR